MDASHSHRGNPEAVGWQVFLIPEDDEGPAFAYTLGLYYSFQHPEILIMGLGLDTMHQLLNNIGSKVKHGQIFTDGAESADIVEGYSCTFRQIRRSHYPEFLGSACRFYGSERFPALQCLWPDKQGFYPWQPGFNEELFWRQWLLFQTPDGA